jgi:hypothetical protein
MIKLYLLYVGKYINIYIIGDLNYLFKSAILAISFILITILQ